MMTLRQNSILHRDIKPENILLSEDSWKSTVKISDFGLAKQIRSADDLYSMTRVGTPYY